MLRQAFNALIKLHSRPVYVKRLGNPDIYSPARITPSNYFRFLEGPSSTTIHGREFVIPIDTLSGTAQQVVSFSAVPTSGKYYLTYGVTNTAEFNYNDAASVIQAALRLISGLESVVVAGAHTSQFTITFYGVQIPTAITATKVTGQELDANITIAAGAGVQFSPRIQRGDKIIHDLYGSLAIDEVVEMCDIGGTVMGYRVRCE